jgi:hypothetical protein
MDNINIKTIKDEELVKLYIETQKKRSSPEQRV